MNRARLFVMLLGTVGLVGTVLCPWFSYHMDLEGAALNPARQLVTSLVGPPDTPLTAHIGPLPLWRVSWWDVARPLWVVTGMQLGLVLCLWRLGLAWAGPAEGPGAAPPVHS